MPAESQHIARHVHRHQEEKALEAIDRRSQVLASKCGHASHRLALYKSITARIETNFRPNTPLPHTSAARFAVCRTAPPGRSMIGECINKQKKGSCSQKAPARRQPTEQSEPQTNLLPNCANKKTSFSSPPLVTVCAVLWGLNHCDSGAMRDKTNVSF